MIHVDPPVFRIDDFLSGRECQSLASLVDDDIATSSLSSGGKGRPAQKVQRMPSPTFSSSSYASVSRRTSTTWFCRYDAVPALLAKVRRLLDVDVGRMEEPQVVRYRPGEEFSWHYDAVPRTTLSGSSRSNGGQRLATLLVYLNDLEEGRGGGTAFRDLEGPPKEEEVAVEGGDRADESPPPPRRRRGRLVVTPRMGTALLFFPAYNDGSPDPRTLHRGETAMDDKTIAQVWIHEDEYRAGVPEGNRQSDAMDMVKNESRRLGFL